MSNMPCAGRPLFWGLAGLGLLLNLAILSLLLDLVLNRRPEAPEHLPRINVPYEGEVATWQRYRRWVVQEDGRHKPFDTFCREAVRTIHGNERLGRVRSPISGHLLAEGHDPVPVVVSWMLRDEARQMGCDWEHHPFILCPHPEVRQLLDAGPGRHVAPVTLREGAAFAAVVRSALGKGDEGTALLSVEREALEVLGRLRLYDQVRQGGGPDDDTHPGNCRLAALDDGAWFSLASLRRYLQEDGASRWRADLRKRRLDRPETDALPPLPAVEARQILSADQELRQAYRSADAAEFADASTRFLGALERINRAHGAGPDPDMVERELWFNQANPFRKAWVAGLAAALLLGGSLLLGRRGPRPARLLYLAGLAVCLLSLGWAAAGFCCRVSISGRPPVGNMYESILWVAFATAALGLVLEGAYRARLIALAAALVSALGFLLADGLPLTFSPSIQPLSAVLRSNYWLVVHVLTIVSSYAPFALAWGLGNVNLALILYAPGRRELIATLSHFCYRCLQVGVLLLFLGTMLGGFWAAESWGRFWAWDPKEVWALVALLCYLVPLHARYVGWVGDFGLAVCSVVCFASVVMAWYGVNFVLGTGLHSYGFGSGDHTGVYLVGLLNLSLVVHASLRYLR